MLLRESQILLRHPPARQLVCAQLRETLALGLAVDAEVHLDDADSIGRQHRFQTTDPLGRATTRTCLAPGIPRRLGQALLVPAGEIESDAAARGHCAPVALEHRLPAGRAIPRRKCVDVHELGIEPFEQLVQHLGATRRRRAGDDEGEREGRLMAQPHLQVEQFVPQPRELTLLASGRGAAHPPLRRPRAGRGCFVRAAGCCCVMQ